MLKTRVITGVILAFIGICIVFGLSPFYFNVAVAIILGIGAFEWIGFVTGSSLGLRLGYSVIFLVLCFLLKHEASHIIPAKAGVQNVILLIGAIFWVFGLVSLFLPRVCIKRLLAPLPAIIVGYVLLLSAFVAFSTVHALAPFAVLYAVLVVAGSDIGAYFAGKAFGQYKLAPEISPKKTWEGFVGGLIAGVILSLILSHWVHFPSQHHYLLLAGISVLLVIFGVVGDLFESQFKRVAGVKDSSNVLPGHGGILDRFDSHLAAMVIFAFVVSYI